MPKSMINMLDDLDIGILENLAVYGPRNLTEIARRVGTSTEMVRLRTKRMSSLLYLRMSANLYHTYLGLRKAVVFFEANPGYETLLLDCLEIKGFCIYLSRCYGRFEGYVGIYVIPKGKETEFRQFLQEVSTLGLAKSTYVCWSTCFHTVNRTRMWFDKSAGSWILLWDKWIDEIQNEGTELPYTLKDPGDFPVKADETDIFILKELEINATTSLIDIARKLGTTLQRVKYHYQRHIMERGLIETFQIFVFPFDRTVSDMYFFTFKFDRGEKMAKFALSLTDKPFVYNIGKILGENAIIVHLYLPKQEFRRFIDSLSKLIRIGFLQGYDYVIQDVRPGTWFREEIHHELFKDRSWIFNHEEHIENLRTLAEHLIIEKIDTHRKRKKRSTRLA